MQSLISFRGVHSHPSKFNVCGLQVKLRGNDARPTFIKCVFYVCFWKANLKWVADTQWEHSIAIRLCDRWQYARQTYSEAGSQTTPPQTCIINIPAVVLMFDCYHKPMKHARPSAIKNKPNTRGSIYIIRRTCKTRRHNGLPTFVDRERPHRISGHVASGVPSSCRARQGEWWLGPRWVRVFQSRRVYPG